MSTTIVGFVTTGTRAHWTGEDDAYVGELVVSEEAAGQGVGRKLMAAAEEWARDAGYRRLTIETGGAVPTLQLAAFTQQRVMRKKRWS